MSNEIVKGSCLCGEIVYEIEGPFKTHKWDQITALELIELIGGAGLAITHGWGCNWDRLILEMF